MNIIKIFIAGAKNLRTQRLRMKALVNDLNTKYSNEGIHVAINMFSYENFEERQSAYDNFIKEKADMVIFIVDERIGEKTEGELRLACETYKEKGKPEVIVFLHSFSEKTPEIEHTESVVNSISDKYYVDYNNTEDLLFKAKDRIDSFVKGSTSLKKRTKLWMKGGYKWLGLLVILLLNVMIFILASSPNKMVLSIQSETELSNELIRQQMVYMVPELDKYANEKLGDILSNLSIETDDDIDRLASTGLNDIVFSSQMSRIIREIRALLGKRDLFVSVKLLETDSIYAGRFDMHDWNGRYYYKTIEENKHAYDNKKKCAMSVIKKGTAYIVSAYSPVASALFDYENSDALDEYINKSPWKEELFSYSNRIEILQQAIADESPDRAYCLLILGNYYEHEGKIQSAARLFRQACECYNAFSKLYPKYAPNIQERINVLEQFTTSTDGADCIPDFLTKQGAIPFDSPCEQLIIISNQNVKSVRGKDYYKADLYTYEKHGNQWKLGPVNCEVNLGVKGIANLNEKREGDKMTPSGYYPLSFAFGLKNDVNTKMEFRELNRNHVWVSDTLSKDYNLWVEDTEGLYNNNPNCERLLSIIPQYKYALVVDYNSAPIIRGKGSAIFIHVQPESNRGTAGCISLPESDIVKLINWLNPSLSPHIYISKKIERL